MSHTLNTFLYAAALLGGMLILFEIGRHLGNRQIKKDAEGAISGIASIESAILGLLALLLAFTFYGAAERFDKRRELIIDETNMIGTAYLRIDLLPANMQAGLRENFRRYVDSRLEFYRKLPDFEAAKQEFTNTNELQEQIWHQSVIASRAQDAHSDAGKLLLPALNDMIDITTTRRLAMQIHPPAIIFVMLFGLAFASSLFAGYGMAKARRRSLLHMIGFAGVMAVSVYVILDMEFPRLGLIRVAAFDQALEELRERMR